MKKLFILPVLAMGILSSLPVHADIIPAVPDSAQLQRPFDSQDYELFQSPTKRYYPETWFHFINGNVDKKGITEDLQAIAGAGLAGVQLFHGTGDNVQWKGVKDPVYCLSEKWEDLVTHAASEARRLGLRFTMQNCPGWAMSGGPWIDLDHTMRNLAYSRTDVKGGVPVQVKLPLPAEGADNDYRDVIVLAFPTPKGDVEQPLFEGHYNFQPTTAAKPQVIDIQLKDTATARSLVFCSINDFNHDHCVDPDINIRMEAVDVNGHAHEILRSPMPYSNWQDGSSTTFALSECPGIKHFRLYIVNRYSMNISYLRLYTGARQQDWEGDAGWSNRTLLNSFHARQSKDCFVRNKDVQDITKNMNSDGTLTWKAPEGNWTILRVGHVNCCRKNGPAPAEATGWECNKLDPSGADVHFKNYIGRLAKGPLNGLLCNMLMDSWECSSQTWTQNMPAEFQRVSGYSLTSWMPALFGYVMDDPETTSRFLYDWRHTLNDLYVNNYFGRMASNAHQNGLTVSYETAPGDITPADCMEYYKWADVPMCEFWQPFSGFLANRNFKPIRPTASAARMYGKPRVSAESFTSFNLTWDEHLQMLKDIANQNMVEGVSHLVFHTYTHNPDATHYFPGTSFGQGIGSPFLRGQTWWKHMPAFTTYLARCTYMLERGKPVSSVLWYLGDEPQQKPDQRAAFPIGYHYDYCNADALLNRLDVKDGHWITPEGIKYDVMWIPERGRMCPETLERLSALVQKGGILIADRPTDLATLGTSHDEKARYEKALLSIWPKDYKSQSRPCGAGLVLQRITLENALDKLHLPTDVLGAGNLWSHRQAEGADWYFICSEKEQAFQGDVTFNCTGEVSVWDPVSGQESYPTYTVDKGRTTVHLEMPVAGNCFVMFNHDAKSHHAAHDWTETASTDISASNWTVTFPSGWGIDAPIQTSELKPWRQLVSGAEGQAFSGTATYATTLHVDKMDKAARYLLQLGKVEMIAVVRVNGQEIGTVWTEPYQADITKALHKGDNAVEIDVTSTWFNRLVYDAGQPEEARKTWVIAGPSKDSQLVDYGLLGPVKLSTQK